MPSKTRPIVSWLEPPEPSSLGRGVLRRLRVICWRRVRAALAERSGGDPWLALGMDASVIKRPLFDDKGAALQGPVRATRAEVAA